MPEDDTTDWKAEAAKAKAALDAANTDVEKWKALSRKNEDQAKSNAEKAKKFDELDEASKTEVEKERARAEAAEKALKDRDAADEQAKADREAAEEAKKVRTEVAKAKGVPEGTLRGATKEDFEAHADELIAAGLKATPAPSSDGQGDTGGQIGGAGEKSADELVTAALGK